MKLDDLFKTTEKIVILLDQNNRKDFLKQAKSEGYKWSLTKDIQEGDECTFRVLMQSEFKIISNISAMSYAHSKELKDLPIFEYKNIQEEADMNDVNLP